MSNLSLTLSKGESLSLTKACPGLKKIVVGLGWDARTTNGADFDLDAMAFLLKSDGKVRGDGDMVFYGMPQIDGKLQTRDGSVIHSGDNRKGDAAGDDEAIAVDLEKLPTEITKIVFTASIYDAAARRQNFGQVNNAYIRIVDFESNTELAHFDLTEEAGVETDMIFGEVYRYNGEWKFKAVGQGYREGTLALCRSFGINISA